MKTWLNAVSSLISLTGFLTGLYFWIYAGKYAASYDRVPYFICIIGAAGLSVLVSLTYSFVSLHSGENRSQCMLSAINVLISAAGLFMLAMDSVFLVF